MASPRLGVLSFLVVAGLFACDAGAVAKPGSATLAVDHIIRLKSAGFSDSTAIRLISEYPDSTALIEAATMKRAGVSDNVILLFLAQTHAVGIPVEEASKLSGSLSPVTEKTLVTRRPAYAVFLGYFRPTNVYNPIARYDRALFPDVSYSTANGPGIALAGTAQVGENAQIEVLGWMADVKIKGRSPLDPNAWADTEDSWKGVSASLLSCGDGVGFGGGLDYLWWRRHAGLGNANFSLGPVSVTGIVYGAHLLGSYSYMATSSIAVRGEVRYAWVGKAKIEGAEENKSGWQLGLLLGYCWPRKS